MHDPGSVREDGGKENVETSERLQSGFMRITACEWSFGGGGVEKVIL